MIDPIVSEQRLEEILTMEGTMLDSPERLQRNEIRTIMEAQGVEPSADVLGLIVACLSWQNHQPAVALWAGHIERAEDALTNTKKFDSLDTVEAALIERFSQPAYEVNNATRDELVDRVLPIVRSSAVAQARPEIWEDDTVARSRVRDIVNKYVEDKEWDLQ